MKNLMQKSIAILGIVMLGGTQLVNAGMPVSNCTYEGEYIADNYHCYYYYVCDGSLTPIWNECPGADVFDPVNCVCTSDVSKGNCND